MIPKTGGWIHNFAVTDTCTHLQGYTIYKITSIVFPRNVPQALTCITVWKRFHDIKRLYRELCRRHKLLKLNSQIPEPNDNTFFNRFDAGVIEQRKKYILQLLDFAAQDTALYKCQAFIEFFRSGHSPNSSPQHCTVYKGANNVDDFALAHISDLHRLNITETDHCIRPYTVGVDDIGAAANDDKVFNSCENDAEASTNCWRFLTPMPSIESEDGDYIYEAALEFSKAVQAEANVDYTDAHDRYRKGVEILANGSKDDNNEERSYIAKVKMSKYSKRADNIFDRFLKRNARTNRTSSSQLSVNLTNETQTTQSPSQYMERPWSELSNYKVLQIIADSVMQVHDITDPLRPIYIMKGIEKPAITSPTQTLFLPQCVPYMVDLCAYFQSEDKIFLLMKQAVGGRLYDYMQSYKPQSSKQTDLNALFPEVDVVPPEEQNDLCSAAAESVNDIDNSTSAAAAKSVNDIDNSTSAAAADSVNDIDHSTSAAAAALQIDPSKLVDSSEKKGSEFVPNLDSNNPSRKETSQWSENYEPPIVTVPEACLKQWASELAVAVHGLHSKGLILGDLHLNNLLLGNNGQLLLTYFYQNEDLDDVNYEHKALHTFSSAGHNVAPERPLTTKSDWWSYGIVLYNILLAMPFEDTHPGHIDYYGCVQYPENAKISDEARDLLNNLLVILPEKRFCYADLQKHAFFKGIDWDEVLKKGLAAAK